MQPRAQRVALLPARVGQQIQTRRRVVEGEHAASYLRAEPLEPALHQERRVREESGEGVGVGTGAAYSSRLRRWRTQQDLAQDAVDQSGRPLAAAGARVADGLVDGRVGGDAVEVANLVEADLEDLEQFRRELPERHAGNRRDLRVEGQLPAKDAQHELAQQVLIGAGETARELAHEGRGASSALEHPAERFDRRVRAVAAGFFFFTSSP